MKLAGGQSMGAPGELVRIEEREERGSPVVSEGARKRAAVELISRQESALRRTARRFSLCADDADDAYQRALEILLRKAPTEDVRELTRWMTTVIKHEALKVRQNRERILGNPDMPGREEQDWVALIPSERDGPAERAERNELIARSREALQALKPQELRALTLLAEGYSYAEIGAITGFSYTKVNRCVAEGRERFRGIVSRSEDGRRCLELEPLLSAFCDGELSESEAAALREHLRVCGHCRSTLRTYRAAPRAAAALVPALPISGSLLERVRDALTGLHSRLPGGRGGSIASQMAVAGGARGAGVAGMAKGLAVCVGAVGGAAACMVAGVVPAPALDIGSSHAKQPAIVRHLSRHSEIGALGVRTSGDAANNRTKRTPDARPDQPVSDPIAPPPPTSVEPVASVPEPTPAPVSEAVPISSGSSRPQSSSGGSAGVGEFGP